ncbi:MAG: cyclic nucleotide-binding domain-containing protein, partial [Thermoleophilia bacterium]|nr:cyclic nucleotide-binding domain-containing protein [Thermoleophilia bacterium]
RGPAGKEVTVDEVGPGDVVGWSTVTGPYVYTATAVTAERSRVIVLRGTKLREILEINNHIGYRVLKGIGNVVARRLTAIQARCAAH